MSWLTRLLQIDSDADSKTGAHLEQSKWTRKTTRSVEVTVETEEVILHVAGNSLFPDATAAREQEANHQAADAARRADRKNFPASGIEKVRVRWFGKMMKETDHDKEKP